MKTRRKGKNRDSVLGVLVKDVAARVRVPSLVGMGNRDLMNAIGVTGGEGPWKLVNTL